MIEVSSSDALHINAIPACKQKILICGFEVTFAATGGRSGSFMIVNFKVLKPEK